MAEVVFSVVVPAYNEALFLPRTLQALQRALKGVVAAGEIVVVDNNSDDATAQVAREWGARVVFEPVNQISRARNAGARHARGEWLIFVDADTLVPPGLLGRALENLKAGACGGGALIAPDRPLPWPYRQGLRGWNLFSRIFRVAAGSFIYCRRDGFEAVAGFSQEVYAAEELIFSRGLKRWARRNGDRPFVIVEDPPVVTSTRKVNWYASWHLGLMAMVLGLFPFALRSRRLCHLWYRRPAGTPGDRKSD